MSFASFSATHFKVFYIVFNKSWPKPGISIKNIYLLHPCDAIPSVFETIFCESLFDLKRVFCCYEKKKFYDM